MIPLIPASSSLPTIIGGLTSDTNSESDSSPELFPLITPQARELESFSLIHPLKTGPLRSQEMTEINELFEFHHRDINKSREIANAMQRSHKDIKDYLKSLSACINLSLNSLDIAIINLVATHGNNWGKIERELLINQKFKEIINKKGVNISHRFDELCKNFMGMMNQEEIEFINKMEEKEKGFSSFAIFAQLMVKNQKVCRTPIKHEQVQRRKITPKGKKRKVIWSKKQDETLIKAVNEIGKDWDKVAASSIILQGKTPGACRQHHKKLDGVKKIAKLSVEEESKIRSLFASHCFDYSKIDLISEQLKISKNLITECLNPSKSGKLEQEVPFQPHPMDEDIIKNVAKFGEDWKKIRYQLSTKFELEDIEKINIRERFKILMKRFPSGPINETLKQKIFNLREKGTSSMQVCAMFELHYARVNSVYSTMSSKNDRKRKKETQTKRVKKTKTKAPSKRGALRPESESHSISEAEKPPRFVENSPKTTPLPASALKIQGRSPQAATIKAQTKKSEISRERLQEISSLATSTLKVLEHEHFTLTDYMLETDQHLLQSHPEFTSQNKLDLLTLSDSSVWTPF